MSIQKNKENYLECGGHQIYYAEYGCPHGKPLLMIHGGSGYTFDMDQIRLPENRRIVVMHQRGIGRSLPEGELRNNTIGDNIDDIERLRAHLDIDKWDIFSWSFGAVFMAAYAFEKPEVCRSLTAYAPYLGSDEDYQVIGEKSPAAGGLYYAFHGSSKGQGIVRSAFAKASHADRYVRFQAYHAAQNLWSDQPVSERVLLNTRTLPEWQKLFGARLVGASLDYELYHERDRFLEQKTRPLSIPVTLIYGDEDVWTAPNSYARTVFPHHQSHIIPGAGHDVHEPIVQDFLKRRLNAQEYLLPALVPR